MPMSFRRNRSGHAYRVTRSTIEKVYHHGLVSPGDSAIEVGRAIGVPSFLVHLILDNDPRCFALACEGYFGVINHGRKPAWYKRVPDRSKVPLRPRAHDVAQQVTVAHSSQPDEACVMAVVETILAHSTFGGLTRERYRRKCSMHVTRMALTTQHLQHDLAELDAKTEAMMEQLAEQKKRLGALRTRYAA